MNAIFRAITIAVAAAGLALPAAGQALFDLQGLPISDEFNSQAMGISGDGLILVGVGHPSQISWRLDSDFNAYALGDLPGGGLASTAFDASYDGSVIVGEANSALGIEAFRWTAETGMVGLGDLDGPSIPNDPVFGFGSTARGVSADGTVVVGVGTSWGGTFDSSEAFRWILTDPNTGAGVMEELGDLPGGDETSAAYGVSADGSVVVGTSSSSRSQVGNVEAFVWTEQDQMMPLGDLPGGGFASAALAVSADGSVIVGQGVSANGPEAFRWEDGVMTPLGDLPGGNFGSVANAVSADGSIVVGASAVRIGDAGLDVYHPFIWDAVNGMRDLTEVFAELGYTLPNLEPASATSISDDGTVVAGVGVSVFRIPAGDNRTEAWLGVLPAFVPVPEPSADMLLLTSVAVLTGLGRARRSTPLRSAAPSAPCTRRRLQAW